MAGVDDTISIDKYQGAKRITISEPKYNLVTTHTARRTFITLSLEKGMRPEVVMKITGHKDWKSFKKYIKIVERIQILELHGSWVQSQPLKVV